MPGFSKQKGEADYPLLALFAGLLVFGLVMLTSASAVIGFDRFGDNYFFVKRQLLYGVLPGIVAFFFFAKLRFDLLKKVGVWTFYLSLVLLVLVFIPGIGDTLGTGAHSWIRVAGISFQPAELVKLGMIFFLAQILAALGKRIRDLQQGFLVALGVGMVPIGLVLLQPDVGTGSILFAILFALLFVAGARFIHLGGLATAAVIAFIILIVIAPYRAARFTTFLHPELDPQGIGYHINQAFLALGSGGWFGVGLGRSQQKFQYLPEVHADSIFAVIGEEMGFTVVVGFLLLLYFIARRGMTLAKHAPDAYSTYVIAGIIMWFMIQSFFNIAAMVGLMPLTGVPLPFVSHGGTALAIAMGGVGVLANLSKRINI